VARPGTTRCCSAVALIAATSLVVSADRVPQSPFPAPPRRAAPAKVDLTPVLFPTRTLWTLDLNVAMTAPAAFYKRHAFFPIEEGRIVAYDLLDGDQLWMADVATTSRPAASPDCLFVAVEDGIVALSDEDGREVWRIPFTEPLATPLVWDNGWLIAATHLGSILALRASDGQMIWRADVKSPAHAPPSLAADRVYVPTEDGRVVALRVDTGAVVWEHRLGGPASEILALDEYLYVGSRDNNFYRLNTKTGDREKIWQAGADVIGMPAVDAHDVFFVSLDNMLRGLSRRTGNQLWRRTMALRPFAGPIKAADVLLVAGLTAQLPAFNMKTGAQVGSITLTGDLIAPPYVTDLPGLGPTVFIVTNDISKGATVTAWTHRVDPEPEIVRALPDAITLTPPVLTPPYPWWFEPLPEGVTITLGAGGELEIRIWTPLTAPISSTSSTTTTTAPSTSAAPATTTTTAMTATTTTTTLTTSTTTTTTTIPKR
jgi:outer membrane protein assembly factor BamB